MVYPALDRHEAAAGKTGLITRHKRDIDSSLAGRVPVPSSYPLKSRPSAYRNDGASYHRNERGTQAGEHGTGGEKDLPLVSSADEHPQVALRRRNHTRGLVMPGKERNPSRCVPSFRSRGSPMPMMTPSCQGTKERSGPWHPLHSHLRRVEGSRRPRPVGRERECQAVSSPPRSLYLDQRVVLRKLAATRLFDFDNIALTSAPNARGPCPHGP